MEPKPILQSKTFIFNFLTVAASVVTYLIDQDIFTNPDVTAGLVVVSGIANVILRAVTSQPVKL